MLRHGDSQKARPCEWTKHDDLKHRARPREKVDDLLSRRRHRLAAHPVRHDLWDLPRDVRSLRRRGRAKDLRPSANPGLSDRDRDLARQPPAAGSRGYWALLKDLSRRREK